MREVDVEKNDLIWSGADISQLWPLQNKKIVKALERKELYCSWFQVKGGDVDDQFPALRVHNRFYTMPLRIQKSVFRHMRLSEHFVNREFTVTGVQKLRIPTALLREKLRTARRFMVHTPHSNTVGRSVTIRIGSACTSCI